MASKPEDALILLFNFKINEGQIFGMLGPNGVGKSTIFNLITGLLSPDYGSIYINSEKINKIPIYERTLKFKIGFVFLMIVVVMFSYIAAAERGERLGVPGFEGTLIFLCLLQAPTILFRIHPDLLDG